MLSPVFFEAREGGGYLCRIARSLLATMGVNGLLGALEPLTRPIVLEHVIKGRVVGVDASIWLHNLMSRHALLRR